MINKEGGTIFRFYGGTAVMREDIEVMGVPPPPLRKTLKSAGTQLYTLHSSKNVFPLLSARFCQTDNIMRL